MTRPEDLKPNGAFVEDVLRILPSWKLTAAALCSCSFHRPDLAAATETSRDSKSPARKTVLFVLFKKKLWYEILTFASVDTQHFAHCMASQVVT